MDSTWITIVSLTKQRTQKMNHVALSVPQPRPRNQRQTVDSSPHMATPSDGTDRRSCMAVTRRRYPSWRQAPCFRHFPAAVQQENTSPLCTTEKLPMQMAGHGRPDVAGAPISCQRRRPAAAASGGWPGRGDTDSSGRQGRRGENTAPQNKNSAVSPRRRHTASEQVRHRPGGRTGPLRATWPGSAR